MPVAEKSLLLKKNGEEVVEVNGATLGLKSRVSDNLVPSARCGTSSLNLSAPYEFTV